MKTLVQSPIRLAAAAALALLSFAGCASTQDAARDDAPVERQLASIDAAVDLTDAQSARIREILAAAETDRPSGPAARGGRPAGADGRAAMENRRAEMEARRAETDRLIEAVLTEEQVEQYRVWRASQQQQRRQGPPRGR